MGMTLAGRAARADQHEPEQRPSVAISRASGPIKVDGDLGDPGWRGAAQVDTFYDTTPGDNVAPPVKTTAWLTYDDKYLYCAFRCEDPDPSKIRAPYCERDNAYADQDFAALMLDCRNDRRSAIEFIVNPRGIQDDLVASDATGNEDSSPDFFWDAAARITSSGWEMEMRIPFSSLRYSDADPQTWGFVLFRNYPRDYRYQIQSAKMPRGSNCWICHYAELTGLTGLPKGGHLVVAPYVTGKEDGVPREGPGTSFVNKPFVFDGGVDVKWNPNADNAVDVTVNPDFSQVESDVAQISANQRFALFYPEKRPFFMEGVDLFQTPFNAVYTRTITSPRWGLRATGKVTGWDYTILSAQDRGGGTVIIPGPQYSEYAPQDFSSYATIFRARKSFDGSYFGFLVSDRENEGGSYNRVVGPDFQWNPSDGDRVTGQFLYSMTVTPDRPDLNEQWDGRKLSAGALLLRWQHDTKTWCWLAAYRDVGLAFRDDNGFEPQVGYRMTRFNLNYTYYRTGFLTRVYPFVNCVQYWDRQGRSLQGNYWPGVEVQGKASLDATLMYFFDSARVGDVLLRRGAGHFEFFCTPGKRVSRLNFYATVGQDFDYANAVVGRGGDVGGSLTWRPGSHLSVQLIAEHQWLNSARNGAHGRLFTADVDRVKAVYTISAKAFLRAIAQWTSTHYDPALYPYPVPAWDGGLDGSVLFAYRLNWQSVLFAGYGTNRILNDHKQLLATERQIFIKVSYAFQK